MIVWISLIVLLLGLLGTQKTIHVGRLHTDPKTLDSTVSLLTITPSTLDRKGDEIHRKGDKIHRKGDEIHRKGDKIHRKTFPESNPTVCVVVLSCNRLNLLETTLRRAIDTLDVQDVPYEVVWIDNGSNSEDVSAVAQLIEVEQRVIFGFNAGMARGFNTGFFRMCRAPYILTLEEDWAWRPQESLGRLETIDFWLPAAIAVLEQEKDVAGVILRNETYDAWLLPSPWKNIRSKGRAVDYRLYCAKPELGNVYGAYTNGASLYDRQRLMALGRGMHGEPGNAAQFPDAYSEANYALRVALKYPCSAMVRFYRDCELVGCNGLFEHTGSSVSAAKPAQKQAMQEGQNIDWLVFDTPLKQT